MKPLVAESHAATTAARRVSAELFGRSANCLSTTLRVFCCGLLLLFCPQMRADQYDTARANIVTYLTGGIAAANLDTNEKNEIINIDNQTTSYMGEYIPPANRTTQLFTDYTISQSESGSIDEAFSRLQTMAIDFATPGASYYNNAKVSAAIISGLSFMNQNYYNTSSPSEGNAYDFEIGSPKAMLNTIILMYPLFTAQGISIAPYTAAANHYDPNTTSCFDNDCVGGNLTDVALVIVLAGVLNKNSSQIQSGVDGLSPFLVSHTGTGDGFYADGSYIGHEHIGYTAHYGAVAYGDVAELLYVLAGSPWAIPTAQAAFAHTLSLNSYAPLIYKGAIMDMVDGRFIAAATDHATGRSDIALLPVMALTDPDTTQKKNVQSFVKYIQSADTTQNVYTNISVFEIANYEAIVNDSSIPVGAPLTGEYVFADMSRTVEQEPGFAIGLAMFSPWAAAFENGSGLNDAGWWQAAGTTYLYTGDLTEFDNGFWPTINPLRLPGTTTDGSSMMSASYMGYPNPDIWVGNSSVDNDASSSGMQFSMSKDTGSTLSGQKSWFMFPNEMVALGTGIADTDSGSVETIVDNRRIYASSPNLFYVNGTAQSTATGWSANLTGVSTAWLQDSEDTLGVGYYFPGNANLSALRESRTGTYADMGGNSTPSYTNTFLNMAFEHGTKPTDAGYEYVVLPNMASSSAVTSYAANPDITIIANSTAEQAVQNNTTCTIGANFWANAGTELTDGFNQNLIYNSNYASMTMHETATQFDLGISEPTHSLSSQYFTMSRSATTILSKSPEITVSQMSPLHISVDTSAKLGATYTLSFAESSPSFSTGDIADSFVGDGTDAGDNNGTGAYMYVKNAGTGFNRYAYMKFSVAGFCGKIGRATITLVNTAGNSGMPLTAYSTSNSWSETTLTYNNAPAIGGTIRSFSSPAVGSSVTIDVTAQALAAQSVPGQQFSIVIESAADGNDYAEFGTKENTTTAYKPVFTLSR